MGEAGAGKDFILHEVINMDKRKNPQCFHEIISCTTRPPREGEQEGVNYHFVNNEYIESHKDDFLELTKFRDWYYGTRYSDLDPDKINIGVFNPEGIRNLLKSDKLNIKVFWIKAPAKERLIRQLRREENPNIQEIFRRYEADQKDFSNINFLYETLDNS